MPWDKKRLLGYVETIQLILGVTDKARWQSGFLYITWVRQQSANNKYNAPDQKISVLLHFHPNATKSIIFVQSTTYLKTCFSDQLM